MEITIPHNFNLDSRRKYQVDVWNDDHRFKALIIHRKAGKTAIALNYLIKEAHKVKDKIFWYICPTYRQGKEVVWRDPEMLSKFIPKVDKLYLRNEVDLSVKVVPTNCYISVKGADKPDSLRGPNPYGVIIDEYEMIDPALWEEIIQPIMMAKDEGFVWFLGTPKPEGVHFKNLFEKAKTLPDWFTLQLNAENSGVLTPEQIKYAKENMTETAYRQEMMCEWLMEGGAVFRNVDKVIKAYQRDAEMGHEYIIGVDLGKYEDYTVLSAFDLTTHKQVMIDRFQDKSWALQVTKAEAMAKRYNNARLRVEANSIGDPIIENMQRRGLRVEPFVTTNKSKKELIENLVFKMEKQEIQLIPDDDQTSELKVFGYEITKFRNIVYRAPEGLHDDCVMALALAVWEMPQLANRPLTSDTAYTSDEY